MDSKIIINTIKEVLDENPNFRRTSTLVNTVYKILCAIYLENKKTIILEAPTGSGKTVIGYMVNFCMKKLERLENNENIQSYLLTSSKLLQDQIEADKEKFNFGDNILAILKGTANYFCTPIKPDSYKNRYCRGMSAETMSLLNCYETCPYLTARKKAVSTDIAVMNYAYFLTTIQNPFSTFQPRTLTICDECHLLPTIVNDLFNFDLNSYRLQLNRIVDLLNSFKLSFGNSALANEIIQLISNKLLSIYRLKNISFQNFVDFINTFQHDLTENYNLLLKNLKEYCIQNNIASQFNLFKKDIDKIADNFERLINGEFIEEYIKSLMERPQDILIQSEYDEITGLYNHIIRDLDESNAIQNYFIKHTNICLYMSATIGNIDDYARMLGLENDEYAAFRLASDFDFSKSPIYLMNSGFLDYKNFQKNIDDVLIEVLKLCKLHSNERGIIHTATFDITNRLREKIQSLTNRDFKERFLFYSTPDEKNYAMELMKSDDDKKYIIVGPSLYEGLDLSDDYGRFNILVKVPYSSMNQYVKAKMERYPKWYVNQTLEKTIQAIGRTNRNKNDWSKVYLMDSLFTKFAYNYFNNSYLERIRKFK
jgi:rad3-related DNA helicase|nr:MAG TPA: helicase [Caudoviricetes sp.]